MFKIVMKIFGKKIFKTRVKGSGGLLFIVIASISVFTLNSVTRLSTADMAKSLANQSAYFATYRAAIYLYNNGGIGDGTNFYDPNTGKSINILNEYNTMLTTSFGGRVTESSDFRVRWDPENNIAVSEYIGPVRTVLTKENIYPDTQIVIIE